MTMIKQFHMQQGMSDALEKMRADLLAVVQKEIDTLTVKMATAKTVEDVEKLNEMILQAHSRKAKILVSNIVLAAVTQFLAKPPSKTDLMAMVQSSPVTRGRPRVNRAA